MRDWSRGQALGYYHIGLQQFNTRKPLHINDDDLCSRVHKANAHDRISERPRSEFTMLSYTAYALEIIVLVRESIDLHDPLRQDQRQAERHEGREMQNYLKEKYEHLIAALPFHFKLGSTVGLNSVAGPITAIPVHRWMLHQQLWSLYLRLHPSRLSSSKGHAFCQLLAQNIISSQTQIKTRCTVCGSLSTNDTQLLKAANLLVLDLLFSSQEDDVDRSSVRLSRSMTRDKIFEAIELLRMRGSTEGSLSPRSPQTQYVNIPAQRRFGALEALIKLEEDVYNDFEESKRATLTQTHQGARSHVLDRKRKRLLKHKVMDILRILRISVDNSTSAMEQVSSTSHSALDTELSAPNVIDDLPNLDVLPVLSNELDFDFWQYLDFDPTPQSLI